MIPTPRPISAARKRQVAAASELIKGLRGAETLDLFAHHFPGDTKAFKQVEAVIKPQRLELRRLLAGEDIHVGIEILDPLLFRLIRDGSEDPLAEAVAELNQQAFHEPGFVLYPLHGYGVMKPFSLGRPSLDEVVFSDLGVAVVPPTKSIQQTIKFVKEAALALGINSSIPNHVLSQEHANRRFRWLSENPLMMIRVRSYAVGAYENQSEYMRKLGLGAAQVMLLSVLVDPTDPKRFSSSRSSDETLDIRHYLVFENAGAGRELSYRRVPMNLSSTALAQLSDLNVDLHLETLKASTGAQLAARSEATINGLGAFHRANVVPGQQDTARTRFALKLLDSIYWFRRSFTGSAMDHEAIVSLAVAFEALLIDSYSGGVTARIVDRATHILKAESQPKAVIDLVRKLFSARGDVVHADVPLSFHPAATRVLGLVTPRSVG